MNISKTLITALVSLILLGSIVGCTTNGYSTTSENKEIYKIETEKSVYDIFPIENARTQPIRVTNPVNAAARDYTITVQYSYLPSGSLVMWEASNSTNFVYVSKPDQKQIAMYALNLEKKEPISLEVFLNEVDLIDLK